MHHDTPSFFSVFLKYIEIKLFFLNTNNKKKEAPAAKNNEIKHKKAQQKNNFFTFDLFFMAAPIKHIAFASKLF